MFMKKPSYRIFDYTPRYYKPEEDKSELRKKRLRFRQKRKFSRRVKTPIYWIILFLIALYFYLHFSN